MGKVVYIPFEIEESYESTEPGKYYGGLVHCYNRDTHEYQKVKLFVHSDQMMLSPQSISLSSLTSLISEEAKEKREIDLSFWNRIRHADEARRKKKIDETLCDSCINKGACWKPFKSSTGGNIVHCNSYKEKEK